MEEIWVLLIVAGLSLICEYIDSSLGGGYGTILTPILVLMGFETSLVVMSVLISQFFSGIFSGVLHDRVGNSEISIKILKETPDNTEKKTKKHILLSEDLKIILITSISGIFGGIAAAMIALSIQNQIIKTYIGLLVVITGILVFAKLKWKFSWVKIAGVGLFAAFNKGISGGGYGLLISSGQIIVERTPKKAISTTPISEAVVCFAALVTYLIKGQLLVEFWFIVAILAGSLGSVPLAVYTVKNIQIKRYTPLIGITAIVLGILTLVSTWLL